MTEIESTGLKAEGEKESVATVKGEAEAVTGGKPPVPAGEAAKPKKGRPPETRYFDRFLHKRVKITPMVAGLPPITGELKSFSTYEIEIEMQNGRTVVIFKHAIYTIEEAPESIIAPKKR